MLQFTIPDCNPQKLDQDLLAAMGTPIPMCVYGPGCGPRTIQISGDYTSEEESAIAQVIANHDAATQSDDQIEASATLAAKVAAAELIKAIKWTEFKADATNTEIAEVIEAIAILIL